MADDDDRPPYPLGSLIALNSLPFVTITDPSLVCAICTLPFLEDGVVPPASRPVVARKLSCGHPFHAHCIFPWLRRSNTCPLCRAVATYSFQAHMRQMLIEMTRKQIGEFLAASEAAAAAADPPARAAPNPVEGDLVRGRRRRREEAAEFGASEGAPPVVASSAGASSSASGLRRSERLRARGGGHGRGRS